MMVSKVLQMTPPVAAHGDQPNLKRRRYFIRSNSQSSALEEFRKNRQLALDYHLTTSDVTKWSLRTNTKFVFVPIILGGGYVFELVKMREMNCHFAQTDLSISSCEAKVLPAHSPRWQW
jgi:hypothetical protein